MKMLLEELGIDQERVALEWVSAAEAPVFAEKITGFTEQVRKLGLLGSSEGLDRQRLMRRIEAARICLAGKKGEGKQRIR